MNTLTATLTETAHAAPSTIEIEVVGPELAGLVGPPDSGGIVLAVVSRSPGTPPTVLTSRTSWRDGDDGSGHHASLLLGQLMYDCRRWRDKDTTRVLPPSLEVIEVLWGRVVTGAGQSGGVDASAGLPAYTAPLRLRADQVDEHWQIQDIYEEWHDVLAVVACAQVGCPVTAAGQVCTVIMSPGFVSPAFVGGVAHFDSRETVTVRIPAEVTR